MAETEKFSKSQIATLKHIKKKVLRGIDVWMGNQLVRNWRNSWKQGILRRGIRACSVRTCTS